MPHGLCLSKISTCAVMFVTTNGILADLASRIDQKLFLSLCAMGLIILDFYYSTLSFQKNYSTLVSFLGLFFPRRDKAISDTALCIVASMKRDWMQAGVPYYIFLPYIFHKAEPVLAPLKVQKILIFTQTKLCCPYTFLQ